MRDTPKGLRPHIGLFGRTNTGKSSLLNAMTGEERSLVADYAGVTADPVEKAFELQPAGPVLFIDTPGIDDTTQLADIKKNKTLSVVSQVDLAVVITDSPLPGPFENFLFDRLNEANVPFVTVLNKADTIPDTGIPGTMIPVSAKTGDGIATLKEKLAGLVTALSGKQKTLFTGLVKPGDTVVLVIPVDAGAPKGRLILPQVMALRELMDIGATAVLTKETGLKQTLGNLSKPPELVVCDSQVVKFTAQTVPDNVPMTTFSVLLSNMKGDIVSFAESAAALKHLKENDPVLIAEACSHTPCDTDIGRIKIPNLLKTKSGCSLSVSVHSGQSFPSEMPPCAVSVQCGGCMLTAKQMQGRQRAAETAGIPMTNYGMAIAYATGTLERILSPFPEALAAFRRKANLK